MSARSRPRAPYAAASARLDYLAELGVTAIELMPVADSPGTRNWGYDGVLPSRPSTLRKARRPEAPRRGRARARPHGSARRRLQPLRPRRKLSALYAPQFFTDRHHTPWGEAINFDDDGSEIVRDSSFTTRSTGSRNTTSTGCGSMPCTRSPTIRDPTSSTSSQRGARTTSAGRVHLVLENDAQRSALSAPRAGWRAARIHRAVERRLPSCAARVDRGRCAPALQRLRSSQPRDLLRALLEGFAYQGEPRATAMRARGEPSAQLAAGRVREFLQNHDQIGNRPDRQALGC